MRLTNSQVSIFEPNRNVMIKEYRRSGADQEEPAPEDLRTPRALGLTVNYLSFNVMDDLRSKSEELALDWYDFLWDRLRAVRKDITQQKICDPDAVSIVERCARFHIHSCYAMNRVKDFDINLNRRNLNDYLQMLRQMYTDLRNLGIRCAGEPEFQIYDVLLHLDQDYASTTILIKTSEHRSSEGMRRVTKLLNAYTTNDYYKFFQIMKNTDYMESCILSLYANQMRLNGLKTIIATCASQQNVWYPVEPLIISLGFDDLNDLRDFVSVFDIEVHERPTGPSLLLDKQKLDVIRQSDKNLPRFKSKLLVESKMCNKSVGQLVYGSDTEEDFDCLPMATDPPEDSDSSYMIDDDNFSSSFSTTHFDSSRNSSNHISESFTFTSPATVPAPVPALNYGPTPPASRSSSNGSQESPEKQQVSAGRKRKRVEWKWPDLEERPTRIHSPKIVRDELKELSSVVAEVRTPTETVENVPQVSPPKVVSPAADVTQDGPMNLADEIQNQEDANSQEKHDEPQDEDSDESDESEEEPPFKPVIRSRQEIADLMPVGKFRTKFKRPTLTLPIEKPDISDKPPCKRTKSQKQDQVVESLREQIDDEVKANKTLLHIISKIFS